MNNGLRLRGEVSRAGFSRGLPTGKSIMKGDRFDEIRMAVDRHVPSTASFLKLAQAVTKCPSTISTTLSANDVTSRFPSLDAKQVLQDSSTLVVLGLLAGS